ncbi:hypothetical protein MKJ04_11380 [Pontibacter sp. E15-1]|uniref:DUF6992 family protein n=1 Tax=Pontibacter sp. E15-1 TaxID=2919918 RepID=UPI001F4FB4E8|nr:hypothetical protein [Pontibacter sp. E15-1]MCJ8165445.1 hypothetical protein [Pontibacter sp. E15-1]
MKKFWCLLPLLFFTFIASAQSNTLQAFNQQQAASLKIGMLILGGWAILNILTGSFKLTKATRSRKFYFQMNLYWNIVNLIIAAAALYSIFSKDPAAASLLQSLKLHVWYKKILYLNVGLDVAYIVLGAYLQERSRNSAKTEQLMGWGKAIVLQGFFLFLLDLVLVILLESSAEQLYYLIPTA